MGFADYLSRNPSQLPPPPSSDDTQFIINTINNFKYIQLNDTIKKMNSVKYQTCNDVIHSKAHTAQKTNAFCQHRNNHQSLAYITNYKSSNPIIPIQSNPFNSSIYKSSIKSSNSKFSVKSSNCNFFYQIINHLKLIPYSQNLISQIHIPQPLLLTQLIFQLLLHFQNSQNFS